MCNTLSPRISVFIFTESLPSMQFSSSTKFSLKEMFSCHKMGHAILSNMVEINQKTYPKDKKTLQIRISVPKLFFLVCGLVLMKKAESRNQKAVNKKCLKTIEFKLSKITEPHHLIHVSLENVFPKRQKTCGEAHYFFSISLENGFPER